MLRDQLLNPLDMYNTLALPSRGRKSEVPTPSATGKPDWLEQLNTAAGISNAVDDATTDSKTPGTGNSSSSNNNGSSSSSNGGANGGAPVALDEAAREAAAVMQLVDEDAEDEDDMTLSEEEALLEDMY